MCSDPEYPGLEVAFHMPILLTYRLAAVLGGSGGDLTQDPLISDRYLHGRPELSGPEEEVHILQNAFQW